MQITGLCAEKLPSLILQVTSSGALCRTYLRFGLHISSDVWSCTRPMLHIEGVCRVQVKASLIVVLTRGGSTARLVAKYKPSIPVLTVAVPVLTTDSLTWTCSGEQPARQCLITRGLLPLLAEGSARATDTDTTDEIIAVRRVSVLCLDSRQMQRRVLTEMTTILAIACA